MAEIEGKRARHRSQHPPDAAVSEGQPRKPVAQDHPEDRNDEGRHPNSQPDQGEPPPRRFPEVRGAV